MLTETLSNLATNSRSGTSVSKCIIASISCTWSQYWQCWLKEWKWKSFRQYRLGKASDKSFFATKSGLGGDLYKTRNCVPVYHTTSALYILENALSSRQAPPKRADVSVVGGGESVKRVPDIGDPKAVCKVVLVL